jgi:hypothetical protein
MFDRSDVFAFTGRFDAPGSRDTEELVRSDPDDLLTVEEVVRLVAPQPSPDLTRREVLSISLPVGAHAAYEAFCDVQSVPRWLPIVRSVHIQSRTPAGRARRAGFVGLMRRGHIRYTLFYSYSDADRSVSWGTAPGSLTLIAGRAQFVPLGERATLMYYQLAIELADGALVPPEDLFHGRHATSVVMNEFRDYIQRVHRSA